MRHSIKDLTLNISEKEYRRHPAYSQSIIGAFKRLGFDNINKLEEPLMGSFLDYGSIVDILLTGNKEEFDAQFIVIDMPELSAGLFKVCEVLLNNYQNSKPFDEISEYELSNACIEAGFWVDSGTKNYYKKRVTEAQKCKDKYEATRTSKGRKVVPVEMYAECCKCVDSLKSNKHTAPYFQAPSPFNTEVEIIYQAKMATHFEDIPVKCMFDILVVDHKNKVIVPVDLKTTSKRAWSFVESFVSFDYDIQARLYCYILNNIITADPYYVNFTIKPFRFIVISKQDYYPAIWEYEESFATGDLIFGTMHKTVLPDWRLLLRELHTYQTGNYIAPLGMKQINSITEYLNNK